MTGRNAYLTDSLPYRQITALLTALDYNTAQIYIRPFLCDSNSVTEYNIYVNEDVMNEIRGTATT